MALAMALPIIWGIQTHHGEAAEWIALTAECICWVALKGTYAQRLRVLAGGAFLALLFATLGSLTGGNIVLSIMTMLGVAFLAGLFKNLGDRGSGLSICVYLMFLLNNAHPAHQEELLERSAWILTGAAWNAIIAILSFIFLPAQQPYRRTIALIWRANATLIRSMGKGWDGKALRSGPREIYLNEKAVRAAMDQSFLFFERMAHQVTREKDLQEYQLAQLRKAAALVAANMGAVNDELESLKFQQLDELLRLKLYDVFKMLSQTADRMAVFILSKRPEEALLVRNRLQRLNSSVEILKEHNGAHPDAVAIIIRRIVQLTERTVKLVERSMELLQEVSDAPVFRSYSLIKTLLILHPKHWLRNLRILFNINSHTMRYALRTALAACLAVAVWKYFDIFRGYWLAFTVMIVMQPYFGATFQKALDRVVGTVLGGIAGGLLLFLPAGLHLKEIMLFISAVAMMYFFRSKYSVASFFITLNLVLLFSVSAELNQHLLVVRSLSTLGGALIAVVAGFALLPAWDKKYLPRYLAAAIHRNYDYFVITFTSKTFTGVWTRSKRLAETENANAFDSFNRFMQEPGSSRKTYGVFYQAITHNVRVTRELNNIHLEQEGKDEVALAQQAGEAQCALVARCLTRFNALVALLPELYRREQVAPAILPENQPSIALNALQINYLEKLEAELKLLHQNLNELLHKQPEEAVNQDVLS